MSNTGPIMWPARAWVCVYLQFRTCESTYLIPNIQYWTFHTCYQQTALKNVITPTGHSLKQARTCNMKKDSLILLHIIEMCKNKPITRKSMLVPQALPHFLPLSICSQEFAPSQFDSCQKSHKSQLSLGSIFIFMFFFNI